VTTTATPAAPRRILIVNPNTSAAFTAKIAAIARRAAAPSTALTVTNPRRGPRSIECVYDELLSAAPTLECVLERLDGHDAVVLACYSDHPAIAALREVTSLPVLGIAEASMHVACLLGRTFGVVTTNDAWEPLLWDAVRRYGLEGRCAAVRATGLPVLALEAAGGEAAGGEAAEAAILAAARRLVESDRAEVLCLGCAGMAGLDKRLEATLGVPVLDGVVCAVMLLEGLLGYGLRTSKRGVYAAPRPKALDDLPPLLGIPYRRPDGPAAGAPAGAPAGAATPTETSDEVTP
jgi:allantoin racemase